MAAPSLEGAFADALGRLKVRAPFALAVSGGGDSTALMHLTAEWAREKGADLSSIFVLTVDHGLRSGSAEEAHLVGDRARDLGFSHHVLVWRGVKPDTGIQAKAREARYELMGAWCREHGIDDLLLAHTADDQVETVAMRLAKESRTVGLAGMAAATSGPRGVRLYRPLLECSGADLCTWLAAKGIGWIEDPSNRDAAFERVRVRDALAGDGSMSPVLQTLAQTAGASRGALDAAADDLLIDAAQLYPAGWLRLDCRIFASAPQIVGQHVLARLLPALGGTAYSPAGIAVERLWQGLAGPGFKGATLGGCRIAPDGGNSAVIGREARNISPLALTAGQGALWDHRFEVESHRDLVISPLSSLSFAAFSAAERSAIKSAVPTALRGSLMVLTREGAGPALPHAGVGDWAGVEVVFRGLRPFGAFVIRGGKNE